MCGAETSPGTRTRTTTQSGSLYNPGTIAVLHPRTRTARGRLPSGRPIPRPPGPSGPGRSFRARTLSPRRRRSSSTTPSTGLRRSRRTTSGRSGTRTTRAGRSIPSRPSPSTGMGASGASWRRRTPPWTGVGSTASPRRPRTTCGRSELLRTSPPSPGGPSSSTGMGRRGASCPLPSPGAVVNELRAVAAVSASDAWAVGFCAGWYRSSTLILHWDGGSWSRVPSPNPNAEFASNELYGIAAYSADDIWAVGVSGNSTNPYAPLALHLDGAAWSAISTDGLGGGGYGSFFRSVSGASSGDMLAVGGTGFDAGFEGGIRRGGFGAPWGGAAWGAGTGC